MTNLTKLTPECDPKPLQTSHAQWSPCHRACYQTLHWPAGAPRDSVAAFVPPDCLPHLPQGARRLVPTCGEAAVRVLVRHHMQRLRHTVLFARVGRCFDCVVQRVADFMVEGCGGAPYYTERHAPLLAGAGLPLLLDEEGREIWLVQLWHALDDAAFPVGLRAGFWHWAEALSVHLLAPDARRGNLTRYPYDTVRSWFAPVRQPSGAPFC